MVQKCQEDILLSNKRFYLLYGNWSIYSVGLSVIIKKEQALTKWTYFLENGFAIDKMDEYWFKFKVLQTKGLIEPTFGVLLKAIFFYFIGMYGYGFLHYSKFKSNFVPIVRCLIKK